LTHLKYTRKGNETDMSLNRGFPGERKLVKGEKSGLPGSRGFLLGLG